MRAGAARAASFAFDMELRQKYQELDGFARFDGQPGGLWEPKLEGDRIRFVVVDSRDRDNEATLYFDGRVAGDAMEGEVVRDVGNQQARFKWRAAKRGASRRRRRRSDEREDRRVRRDAPQSELAGASARACCSRVLAPRIAANRRRPLRRRRR